MKRNGKKILVIILVLCLILPSILSGIAMVLGS